jgi:hypothetical protein
MSYQIGPSPQYTPEQLAQMLVDVNAGVDKQVHELVKANFVDMADYKRSVANTKRYKRYQREIPDFVASPWDNQQIPVGAWRWDRGYHVGDVSVARLELHAANSPDIFTYGMQINNDVVMYRELSTQKIRHLIENGFQLPDLEAYGVGGQVFIIDGHRRLYASKQLGLNLRIWVEQLDGVGMTLTRSAFIRKAQTNGHTIPAAVLAEFNAGFGEEMPDRRYAMTHREKRRCRFPSVGDQLDAMFKARQGDTSAIEAIDAQIAAVKASIPKPNP